MSSSSPPIAEKLLRARSLDGEEWDMRIGVWPPMPTELAPWACHVEITRLFSPPKLICGEDSWQAHGSCHEVRGVIDSKLGGLKSEVQHLAKR